MSTPIESMREDRPRRGGRGPRVLVAVAVVVAVVVAGAVAFIAIPSRSEVGVRSRSEVTVTAPTSPPAGTQLCNGGSDSSALTGPSSAPAGAVTIPAGDNQSGSTRPNTTYYLASGTHTLGSSQYGQFQPQNGDTFIGAPGAILNGEGINQSAFDGTSTGVTIEYLTVENFVAPDGQMVVNHDGGANWTVRTTRSIDNGGAGVGLGTGDVVESNCLSGNDEYGFSSFGGVVQRHAHRQRDQQERHQWDLRPGGLPKSYSVTGNVATIDTKAPVDLHAGGTIVVGATGGCTFSWCANLSDSALNGTWTITCGPPEHQFTFDVTTGERGDDQRPDRDDRRPDR